MGGGADRQVAARTLVTGAAGFVGTHLCATLVAAGVPVRGAWRGQGALVPGVEPAVVPDLLDRAALRAALAGVECVVHLAARVHVMRETAADPLDAFRRVNVEGTRALLEEAAGAGVRRVVVASSIKALGEAGAVPWTEADEPRPVDPYGISKLEAERLVASRAPGLGVEATILRLPLVYGAGVGANMLRLFRAVDRGLPLPFGRIHNRRSLVYVGNLVAAVRTVLDSPAAAGELFHVSDAADMSTAELVRAIGRALGRRPRLVPVPPGLLAGAGRMGDMLSRFAPMPVTTAVVQRLVGSLALDVSKLGRTTGFRPPYTPAEGLAATAAWYRAGPGASGAAA